jgi:hypothetical protein
MRDQSQVKLLKRFLVGFSYYSKVASMTKSMLKLLYLKVHRTIFSIHFASLTMAKIQINIIRL